MKYPSILNANAQASLVLSTGEKILVPKATPQFRRWSGEQLKNTYGGKALIDVSGEPLFAELAILRAFKSDGWSGVWVDTFGNRFRTIWEGCGVDLPPEKKLFLDRLNLASNTRNGCWDVFCWRNDEVVFAEAKCLDNDRIRSTQVRWLEAVLRCGLKAESFLLVEWSFA